MIGYVYIPPGPHGEKVGLDDYLGKLGNDIITLPRLALREPLPPPGQPVKADAPTRPDLPPQDGAELLDLLKDVFRTYTVQSTQVAYDALALWVLHTHCTEHLEMTPRLLITGATKGVGKSRVLEVAGPLCFNALTQSSTTAAYLFRRIDQGAVTLLLDECDSVFGDRDNEALRNVLNAGFARGNTVGRVNLTTMETEDFETFAPVMLAGIGKAAVPDTVRDRSIVLTMRRRLPSEPIARLHRRTWVAQAPELRERLATWAYDVGPKLRDYTPAVLTELPDRAWDIWEPLVAIADLAGGDWPARTRAAAIELTGLASKSAPVAGTALQALTDVKRVFTTANVIDGKTPEKLTPTELARALNWLPDSDWRELRRGEGISVNQLSRYLREFDIVTAPEHPEGDSKTTVRYFRPGMFADAWERNLTDDDEGGEV